MGLDMYLYKKTYVQNWDYYSQDERYEITITQGGKPTTIKRERISYILEEVAYWRNFKALHGWFVDNCGNGEDDCKEVYVSESRMIELLSLLKRVDELLSASEKITKKVDSNKNEFVKLEIYACEDEVTDLLPPESGFFFGSFEINDYYAKSVRDSIEIFESLIAEGGDFYYQASW